MEKQPIRISTSTCTFNAHYFTSVEGYSISQVRYAYSITAVWTQHTEHHLCHTWEQNTLTISARCRATMKHGRAQKHWRARAALSKSRDCDRSRLDFSSTLASLWSWWNNTNQYNRVQIHQHKLRYRIAGNFHRGKTLPNLAMLYCENIPLD